MNEDNKDFVQSGLESDDEIQNENFKKLLDDIPPEHKKEVLKIMSLQMSAMKPYESPVTKKITEEHITTFLENNKKEMELDYAEKKHRKYLFAFIILVTIVFIIVVIILLKDKPEIMEKIIYTFAGLVAGAAGGYGIGRSRRDD